ncbi:MAG: hypothetical protein L0L57_07670 [Alkalibacterium sp.]|uniref:PrcB C-terminal n=1 Tax=Alkalibacterium gilvum TaxID=1130080 RepID=A0A1H6W4T7_9LACT|nr:hypothetical protein [Alkalibacterium gilvum]MDN6311154.1 hypothetical protein [Psychroflexus sp.]MDN6730036.1 hypothetical protein [Alkalibacterium sp.]SEJ07305.1 hypothetical protein SAMN04488113_1694 [Alkalibacterium gilvum]
MRSIPKIILSFSFIFLLYACTNSIKEDVSVSSIDSSRIDGGALAETLLDIETEGVYQLNTDQTSYIIFNGIENEYKNVEAVTRDGELQIIFNKVASNESDKQVYEVIPYPLENIDTIKLIQNKKNITFKSIFVRN